MPRVYIIAEAGNTHEGSLGLARQFVRTAADCGADAIKFQTHIFDAESLPDAPAPPYFTDESRRDYFERTAFTEQQWRDLKTFAEDEIGIDFLSSAFSIEAADMLERIDIKAHKVPSGEVTNLPLLEHLGKTGKRIYLSSGMSTWTELDRAVSTLRSAGCNDLVVFQCTSAYPCPPQEAGLNVLTDMVKRYETKVGFSDHTMGTATAVAAVVLGTSVIEKHFTLSRHMYGSDAAHSMEPADLETYTDCIRQAEAALSHPIDKDVKAASLINLKTIFEKSIVAADDLAAGTVLKKQHLAFKKPGSGIPAADYQQLIGRKLACDIKRNHMLTPQDIASA